MLPLDVRTGLWLCAGVWGGDDACLGGASAPLGPACIRSGRATQRHHGSHASSFLFPSLTRTRPAVAVGVPTRYSLATHVVSCAAGAPPHRSCCRPCPRACARPFPRRAGAGTVRRDQRPTIVPTGPYKNVFDIAYFKRAPGAAPAADAAAAPAVASAASPLLSAVRFRVASWRPPCVFPYQLASR